MKKIITSIFLFISPFLNAQIEKNELVKLESLLDEFEIVLKKYYPDSKLDKRYKKYLGDLIQRKLNSNIIHEKNSVNKIQNLMKTEFFKKIWTLNPKKKERRKHIINFKGEFYTYLISNQKNSELKQSLIEFRQLVTSESITLRPSPFVLLGSYNTYLKDSEYILKVNKLGIAFLFYYDIMIDQKFNK